MVLRLATVVVASLVALTGCSAPSEGSSSPATDDGALSKSDFRESQLLPYQNGWLDPPRALSGLNQHDRLAATTRDYVRCSAMVALGAAIVGGHDAFEELLGHTEQKRGSTRLDGAALATVREDFESDALTVRDLHLFADAIYRGWAGTDGASDGQIAAMIRASGYVSTNVGTTEPVKLAADLKPGDVVPINLDLNGDGSGWHVVLVWSDAAGTVRLYDSNDTHGSHVSGNPDYFDYLRDPSATWDLAETFHRP